ncbi:hypothetical protein Tco_1320318 [Tanacetum coccineum]
MEKKSVIARLNKVSSPDGDYLVIYRANGNFKAFNYLMEKEMNKVTSGVVNKIGRFHMDDCMNLVESAYWNLRMGYWLVQDQTVLGKDYSNLLIADSLLKTIWFINAPWYGNEALSSPPKANVTMLKDFTREDLIELYRLVIKKYGTNRPEDAYDRVLCSDLKTMFDLPLNEDVIWSLPLQQKMISWRYYDKCAVHCLTLEACNIYMLADRKYPLSKDVCQVMLKMKLLDGKMNEVCYKLLKMIEKQAGVKK